MAEKEFFFISDDIIRLRQHQQNIIDSDEYEDDDEPSSSSSALQRRSHNIAEVEVDPTVQPTKKLNGVRRINDAVARERTNILNEPNMNSERLISFSVERVINQHSPIHSNYRQVTENSQILSSDSSSTTPIINNTASGAIESTQLPQTQDADSLFNISNISDVSVNINHINHNNINNSSGSSVSHIVMPNRRRRAHMAFSDNYSSHSNSRLSNSSYPDETVESSASSSYIVSDIVPETNENALNGNNVGNSGNDDTRHSTRIYTTPLKRCRITIIPTGDDGEVGSDTEAATKWNHDNNNSNGNILHNDHDYPISSSSIHNVNSHNNFHDNSMELNGFCVDENTSEVAASNLQKQHHRNISNGSVNNNTYNASHHNYESNREHIAQAHHQQNTTLLLRTPDSGISIGATVTPGQTSTVFPSSTDSTSRWHHYNGGGMLSSDGGTTPNNSGTVLSHRMLPLCDDNTNATMGLFQKKVARVRRNYRKKFAEDSDESD